MRQGTDFLINCYQKPLFDYISRCRHLNLEKINWIINTINKKSKKSKTSIIQNKIFNLIINENTKYTHLYIPYRFDYQIHLIPEAERCLSEIKFLCCTTNTMIN